jgi:ADP-dependent NAD(P)H-hydrate dehydratase / NAD(P)H-hydrate epimerase
MKVVTVSEMKSIEEKTYNEFGFSENLIIENFGLSAADFMQENFLNDHDYGEIIILTGKGNNGADSLAIGRHLTNRGYSVRAFILFPGENSTPEQKQQLALAKKFGVKISEINSVESFKAYFSQIQDQYLVIDGIVGTSFKTPLSNYLFEIIETVNSNSTMTIAIDIPTGITGDGGTISSASIVADYTLAVGLPKTGHFISEGAKRSGELVVIDAGFPTILLKEGDKYLLTQEVIGNIYQQRSKFAHKNTFGHSLVIGGSHGLTGALVMASNAALKVGTGLVTAATWENNYNELTSRITPEIMTGVIPTDRKDVVDNIKAFSRYDSIVLGPGLGRSENVRETVLEILNNYSGPLVIDADAIRVLSLKDDLEIFQRRKSPTIFTPHIGEFAHLLGISVEEVLEKPLEYLKKMVDLTNSCFILKAACTFLAFPNGETYINYFPNDGMATGGSGDVLAGVLGGMLAQYAPEKKVSAMFEDKEKVFHGLCLGVALHTLAGKHAAINLGERTMSAMSIIEHFSDAFKELNQSH